MRGGRRSCPREPLPHLPLGARVDRSPEFSWVGETQRHIGTVVHAQLALIADAPALPTAEQLEAQRAAVLRQLRREGVPERERAEAANLVLTALERTLADERAAGYSTPDTARRTASWP